MRTALATLLLLTTATLAHAAGPKASDVEAKLVADVSSIQAGKPFTVAIVLKTQPKWHIYWKNPGDAGSATEFSFHVPYGYLVSPIEFPLPIKFSQPGDIVAYGYTGTTVFLATVTPPGPREFHAGNVKLGVDVSWLSCSNVCVPGGAKLSLELPTAKEAGEARAENADLFAQARAMIPAATPPRDIVQQVQVITDQPGHTGLEISWKTQPKGDVDVFPLTPDGLELSDIQVHQDQGKTKAVMKWRRLAGAKVAPEPMPVLVAYRDDKGQRHGFFSSIDLGTLLNRKP